MMIYGKYIGIIMDVIVYADDDDDDDEKIRVDYFLMMFAVIYIMW